MILTNEMKGMKIIRIKDFPQYGNDNSYQDHDPNDGEYRPNFYMILTCIDKNGNLHLKFHGSKKYPDGEKKRN